MNYKAAYDEDEEHAMIMTKPELAGKAIDIAERIGVPPEMVCAIIEVASGWNADMAEWQPTSWLLMQHPVDFGGEQNWTALGTRWGCMQVLGQEAWMAGYKDLTGIGEPEKNIEAGCKLLKSFASPDERKMLMGYFGVERRSLAIRALAVLPQYKKFVEARPCVNT